MRIALGLSYSGESFSGWQSQSDASAVQDAFDQALSQFCNQPTKSICAGRTDAGVHALQQVVHIDSDAERREFSWVRGLNALLPNSIAVQWAQVVPLEFHARFSALRRSYRYILVCSRVRPSLGYQRVGWLHLPLQAEPMQRAANLLLGEHDFSAFRAADCQAKSAIKTLYEIKVTRLKSGGQSESTLVLAANESNRLLAVPELEREIWQFDFSGNAFLHHMVRNILGCLIWIGQGRKPVEWLTDVLDSRSRKNAAPTLMPDGLYFLGPSYPPNFGLPCPANLLDAHVPLM